MAGYRNLDYDTNVYEEMHIVDPSKPIVNKEIGFDEVGYSQQKQYLCNFCTRKH